MLETVILTLLMAMTPVLELRGALPFGVARGLSLAESLILSIIGNMLPVPLVMLFSRRIFAWLKHHSKWLGRIAARIEQRAEKKGDIVKKYEVLGLAILVAIPLPGTGAWTGAIVAALMDIRLKRAVPAIFLGVIAAGLIVCTLTFGVGALLGRI